MKKIIIKVVVIVLTVCFFSCGIAYGNISNKTLVKKYCHKYYPNKKIVYTNNWSKAKKKSKTKIYVVVYKTISHGKYGLGMKDKGYTAYNKKVRKGRKVTSYIIFNPNTNYCDDVVAVIDNGKIR